MRVERQRSILLTPAVEDYTWMLANRDMRLSLQSFGDFQADSLKETGQAGECQVNEMFERIESTAQYRGFSTLRRLEMEKRLEKFLNDTR